MTMGTLMYLKRLRRLSSFENADIEGIQRIEFRDPKTKGPDLEVSAYLITDDHALVVRVTAEHCASLIDPVAEYDSVDLTDVLSCRVDMTEGRTLFAFTRAQHRQFIVPDVTALHQMIALLRQQLQQRTRTASQREVKAYILTRLEEQDREWLELCANKPQWKKWARRPEASGVKTTATAPPGAASTQTDQAAPEPPPPVPVQPPEPEAQAEKQEAAPESPEQPEARPRSEAVEPQAALPEGAPPPAPPERRIPTPPPPAPDQSAPPPSG